MVVFIECYALLHKETKWKYRFSNWVEFITPKAWERDINITRFSWNNNTIIQPDMIKSELYYAEAVILCIFRYLKKKGKFSLMVSLSVIVSSGTRLICLLDKNNNNNKNIRHWHIGNLVSLSNKILNLCIPLHIMGRFLIPWLLEKR